MLAPGIVHWKKSFNMCFSSPLNGWNTFPIGHIEVIDIHATCHRTPAVMCIYIYILYMRKFLRFPPTTWFWLILQPFRSSPSSCSQAHTRDIHTDLLLTVLLEFLGATKAASEWTHQMDGAVWGLEGWIFFWKEGSYKWNPFVWGIGICWSSWNWKMTCS